MARSIKSNALKSKAKAKVSAKVASDALKDSKKKRPEMKLVVSKPVESKEAAKPQAHLSQPAKPVSSKLIETIEKRKKDAAKSGAKFGRPMGRRGRRPKALAEYVPGNGEEEQYAAENEYEGLEYDTGIRVKERSDDAAFSLERFEEFDEELNFDW